MLGLRLFTSAVWRTADNRHGATFKHKRTNNNVLPWKILFPSCTCTCNFNELSIIIILPVLHGFVVYYLLFIGAYLPDWRMANTYWLNTVNLNLTGTSASSAGPGITDGYRLWWKNRTSRHDKWLQGKSKIWTNYLLKPISQTED